jgi:hypothetical protein
MSGSLGFKVASKASKACDIQEVSGEQPTQKSRLKPAELPSRGNTRVGCVISERQYCRELKER